MRFAAFVLLITGHLSLITASEPATIVTLSGSRYEKAIVTGLAPDAISVTHSSGVARIPFIDLSPEIQKQYGYDPLKAAEYQKAVAQIERARQQAEQKQAATAEQAKRAERQAALDRLADLDEAMRQYQLEKDTAGIRRSEALKDALRQRYLQGK